MCAGFWILLLMQVQILVVFLGLMEIFSVFVFQVYLLLHTRCVCVFSGFFMLCACVCVGF